jgi:hypothetical protein
MEETKWRRKTRKKGETTKSIMVRRYKESIFWNRPFGSSILIAFNLKRGYQETPAVSLVSSILAALLFWPEKDLATTTGSKGYDSSRRMDMFSEMKA